MLPDKFGSIFYKREETCPCSNFLVNDLAEIDSFRCMASKDLESICLTVDARDEIKGRK